MSNSELVIAPRGEVDLPDNANVPDIVRTVVARGGGPVEILGLLEAQERWERREAEKEFVAARARLKFPPIKKTKKSYSGYYAPWDEIQEIIDPILAAEGFTLRFSCGEPNAKGMVPITGTLSHRLGHSTDGTIYQPVVKVTTAMNDNQAMGSAYSYGMRYCAAGLLNLRFVGMDDDAASMSVLIEQERTAIEDMLHEIGDAAREPFLKFVGVKAVADIQRGAFIAAMNYLHAKRRQLGAKK